MTATTNVSTIFNAVEFDKTGRPIVGTTLKRVEGTIDLEGNFFLVLSFFFFTEVNFYLFIY